MGGPRRQLDRGAVVVNDQRRCGAAGVILRSTRVERRDELLAPTGLTSQAGRPRSARGSRSSVIETTTTNALVSGSERSLLSTWRPCSSGSRCRARSPRAGSLGQGHRLGRGPGVFFCHRVAVLHHGSAPAARGRSCRLHHSTSGRSPRCLAGRAPSIDLARRRQRTTGRTNEKVLPTLGVLSTTDGRRAPPPGGGRVPASPVPCCCRT